ncbi:hypothetical protein WICPIJ_002023 [Wickerhamomyces pijperi]|uniref:Uncharacterized protein n=1 Tax=Wickerhamomyces pijperi TaxID=599730 RepID=A0A9P8QAG6_WICPI|nr:hypothetical protein WICPIJ_002023 [Wickerhamomyces pijperi]
MNSTYSAHSSSRSSFSLTPSSDFIKAHLGLKSSLTSTIEATASALTSDTNICLTNPTTIKQFLCPLSSTLQSHFINHRQDISDMLHRQRSTQGDITRINEVNERLFLLIVDAGKYHNLNGLQYVSKALSLKDEIINNTSHNTDPFKLVLKLGLTHDTALSQSNPSTIDQTTESTATFPVSEGILKLRKDLIQFLDQHHDILFMSLTFKPCQGMIEDRLFNDMVSVADMRSLHFSNSPQQQQLVEDEDEYFDQKTAQYASSLSYPVSFTIPDPSLVNLKHLDKIIKITKSENHLVSSLPLDSPTYGVIHTTGNDDWFLTVIIDAGVCTGNIFHLKTLIIRYTRRVVLKFQGVTSVGGLNEMKRLIERINDEGLMKHVLGFEVSIDQDVQQDQKVFKLSNSDETIDHSHFVQDTTMETSVVTHMLGPELKALDLNLTSTPLKSVGTPQELSPLKNIRRKRDLFSSGIISKKLFKTFDLVSKNISDSLANNSMVQMMQFPASIATTSRTTTRSDYNIQLLKVIKEVIQSN